MIKITNASELNERVKSFKALHSKVLSNCFLMPDEINRLAESGNLHIAEYPGWLFVISDTPDYSNLYYYTCENSDAEEAKKLLADSGDRELFIDIVTKNSRGDRETPEKLIKAGFASPYKNYVRLYQFVKDMDFDKYNPVLAEGYHWCEDFDDYETALKLWKFGLDEKSTPLPTKESFYNHKQDGSILFIVDDNKELAAIYVISVSGNQALLQHLSVSTNHRRKHLGDSMICKSFHYCRDRGVKKFIFWAFEENVPILTLMKRYGFSEDGTRCEQLIVNK